MKKFPFKSLRTWYAIAYLIREVILVIYIFFQSVLAHEPLRMSFEDLHSVESKREMVAY